MDDPVTRFAATIATLGRGPGRSRPLSRAEAREAFGLVLSGQVHPAQLGAFLMLLRYRGEDAEEITGLVEAARDSLGLGDAAQPGRLGRVDLDWPSYGAGRTRGAPWFLLSALALAQTGVKVLMHGTNAFSGGIPVHATLSVLGLRPCRDAAMVAAELERCNFAYWPAESMAPQIDALLAMRRLFGLRSPVNTVARLIDPGCAGVSVDGVFHPAYIAVHLAVAERLGRRSLVVVKGGGGEAERPPAKPVAAHLWRANGRSEFRLPALGAAGEQAAADTPADVARLWHDEAGFPAVGEQTVIGTIALALLALQDSPDPVLADRRAAAIWHERRPGWHAAAV